MDYFKQHNIKSITLKGQELVIEYQNSQTETKLVNTNELKAIQTYLQTKGVNSLAFSDLQAQTQTPTGFNWKSPWVIGIGVVLVMGMIGLILYFINKNKEEKEEII